LRYVQLRAFHQVATRGSFSNAAEALHLTQPAISDQVRKLEAEYDIRLFDRQKKQIRLTAAGRRLLDITHRLFEAEQQALEYLSESQELRSANLRIIADSAHHILHVLGPFRRRHPHISVTLHGGNTQTVLARLRDYSADIGVLGEIPESAEFETLPLGSSPIVAFVARTSPLASRSSISLEDLCREPLVLREKGSLTRARLEDAARKHGIALSGGIEAEGRESVREIVASGGGTGIVSLAEFGEDPRLAKLDITGCDMRMEEAIICLRERTGNKAIRAFMEAARDATRG
jgi:aminoethylphosphonate catabolism LysR family transcriptional regulator